MVKQDIDSLIKLYSLSLSPTRHIGFQKRLSVCLFVWLAVCLVVTLFKTLRTDCNEILWRSPGWYKEQMNKIWWRSGSPFPFHLLRVDNAQYMEQTRVTKIELHAVVE